MREGVVHVYSFDSGLTGVDESVWMVLLGGESPVVSRDWITFVS